MGAAGGLRARGGVPLCWPGSVLLSVLGKGGGGCHTALARVHLCNSQALDPASRALALLCRRASHV